MIEVATEKATEERECAEKIREKFMEFIEAMKRENVPIAFAADELTRYIALFRIFGITNGREKYILKILSSELDEELRKIEADARA